MNKATYKTTDLFGNEEVHFVERKKAPGTLFDDYEGFVEKFEVKKTTDDCYTPKAVFTAVVEYVRENVDIEGFKIVRPFFPGGDYKSIEYSKDAVVIDNPPFSILTEICRFYMDSGVRFFLFAPHLTLFSSSLECTRVVAGCDVIYDNGANVKTSFITNMFGNVRVLSCPELFEKVADINKQGKVRLPKYVYPIHVLTVSDVQRFTENGIRFRLEKDSISHCRGLESQKQKGKAIFGSGFLLSERAAAERAAAERAAAERAAAERAAAERADVIQWSLSSGEIKTIENLK